MADETKKEVVSEQDGKGNETAKEQPKDDAKKEEAGSEKKEGGFSKWWKGVKKNMDDSALESHIETSWNNTHHQFDIYVYGGGLFSGASCYGEVKDGFLTYFGTEEVQEFSVIVDSKDQKAYYAGKAESVEVKVVYDGTEYTRKGVKIALDSNAQEVNVIKADKKYYLYKGVVVEKK